MRKVILAGGEMVLAVGKVVRGGGEMILAGGGAILVVCEMILASRGKARGGRVVVETQAGWGGAKGSRVWRVLRAQAGGV